MKCPKCWDEIELVKCPKCGGGISVDELKTLLLTYLPCSVPEHMEKRMAGLKVRPLGPPVN
ncbi:MAG: hypothetical protein QW835_05740 [Candidatus Hadarchaeum sp.]|uniref:hypothetical protein n=1 Tax=Candidatus Hadarchaeum sp. TaxID=2883567 RepID=UPI00316C05B3